jgi:hypothetical protein
MFATAPFIEGVALAVGSDYLKYQFYKKKIVE